MKQKTCVCIYFMLKVKKITEQVPILALNEKIPVTIYPKNNTNHHLPKNQKHFSSVLGSGRNRRRSKDKNTPHPSWKPEDTDGVPTEAR